MSVIKRVAKSAYAVLYRPWSYARSHPWMISALFRVKTPPDVRLHWDTTTLALRSALTRKVRPDDRVLEVGIGEGALLAIYVNRRFGVLVDGVDISQSRVATAKRVAARTGLGEEAIRVWASDLFENVEGQYSLVFFNPPYVRTAVGRELDLTRRLGADGDQVWDGGDDGTRVIRRFMGEISKHLLPGGRVLVGVQDFYVGELVMREIGQQNGFDSVSRIGSRWLPSAVYEFRGGRG